MARQPEPDLEFTEEELEQTMSTRPTSPMHPRKKSGGGRSMLWILLLALVAGIGYLAMEPDKLNEWLSPYLGDSPPPAQPPVAMKPRPAPPAPVPPAPAPEAPAPQAEAVPPPPSAAAPVPPAAAPAPPAPAPVAAAPKPATANLSPMFAEGQKVTVMADPINPSQNVVLWVDPAGSKPGTAVRVGATLTVLDGDLQPTGWVYQVASDEGVKGWVSEKRLRLKF